MDEAAWLVEFEKYKQSPEFKYKNSDISMTEFKFIWWMEYGHRMWGRTIGGFFYIPAGTDCLKITQNVAFEVLAFSINFCPIKTDLSGNTV